MVVNVAVSDEEEEEEEVPPEEGSWEHWEEVTRFLHCSPCAACVTANQPEMPEHHGSR